MFGVLCLALALASCSSAPKPTDRYLAPAVAPLRAQVVAAKASAHDARTAIAKAEALAPNIPDLRLALTDARHAIDSLTAQLLGAEVLIDTLETQVASLTADANRERADKIVAQDRADKTEAQKRSAVGQRNKLLGLVLALLLVLFRKPILSGAAFLARKFAGIPW